MRKTNTRLFLIKYLRSTQAGFSLIESLVAVLVVAILMAAIVPTMVVTTASRVQARRVDLATQAARSYVDGVRGNVIDIVNPPPTLSDFPFRSSSQYFTDTPANAPSSSTVTNLFKIPGVQIDANGNGFSFDDPLDLVIQPLRTGSTDPSIALKQGFYMQVRVYRADAFASTTAIKPGITLQTGQNEATCPLGRQVFTGNLGSQSCPLVIMKVEVYPKESTFSDIKERLQIYFIFDLS